MSYELEPYKSDSIDTFDNESDIIEADWTPVSNDTIDVEYAPVQYADDDIQDADFSFYEPDTNQYPIPYETTELSPYEAANTDYDIERYTASYINTEPDIVDAPYTFVETPVIENTHTETAQEWINKQQIVSNTQMATYQQNKQDTYISPYEAVQTNTQPATQTHSAYQPPTQAPPVNQQPNSDSYVITGNGEAGENYPFWFGRKKSPNESDEVWYLRHLWFQKHWDSGAPEFPEAEFHVWFSSLRPWERGLFAHAGKQIAEGEWRYGDTKKQDKIYKAIDNYYERVNAARNRDPVGMLFAGIRRLL